MIRLDDLYRDVQVPGGLTALVRLETLRAGLKKDAEPAHHADEAATIPAPPPRRMIEILPSSFGVLEKDTVRG